MFAVTATSTDPDDPLRGLTFGEHPEPEVPDDWVVVEVQAASLNHHDVWTLRGVGVDPDRLPIVLGCDAAGVTADGVPVVVHAVVSPLDGTDETLCDARTILSERYDGTFAERVVVPRRNVLPLPASLGVEEAACLPVAWLTAYRMLFTRGELRPGQRVLIQGAGGGVSTAALQLAKAAGAHVTVSSRDASRGERARGLGADEVVEAGGRLTERVDVVIETVGQATWDHSLKSLRPGGVVVVAGATSGSEPPADLSRVFFRQLRVVGSTMGTREELARLLEFLAVTGVRPLIDDVVPLADARGAFERMIAGDVFGKIVLTT
ncbi:MAG: zinc-binding dehydrogenase [Nitriliruptoraceae bacterium]